MHVYGMISRRERKKEREEEKGRGGRNEGRKGERGREREKEGREGDGRRKGSSVEALRFVCFRLAGIYSPMLFLCISDSNPSHDTKSNTVGGDGDDRGPEVQVDDGRWIYVRAWLLLPRISF